MCVTEVRLEFKKVDSALIAKPVIESESYNRLIHQPCITWQGGGQNQIKTILTEVILDVIKGG